MPHCLGIIWTGGQASTDRYQSLIYVSDDDFDLILPIKLYFTLHAQQLPWTKGAALVMKEQYTNKAIRFRVHVLPWRRLFGFFPVL